MISSPTVSVVIATYNYGCYLAGAIKSVLDQSFQDYEVVIVDDGSTDNTAEIVRGFESDPRIRYICCQHAGHPKTKNRGIRESRGEFIAFLDADDLWLPTKLEKQVRMLRSNAEVGVVYSSRFVMDHDGRDVEYVNPTLHRGWVAEPLMLANFVCFSSALMRRSTFAEVDMFDESIVFPIDYDLWLRLSLRYQFDYVDEQLVRYRRHANMTNLKPSAEKRAEIDKVVDRFLNAHGGRKSIRPRVLRQAAAIRCCDIAYSQRSVSYWSAAKMYLEALSHSPFFLPAWKGLLSASINSAQHH